MSLRFLRHGANKQKSETLKFNENISIMRQYNEKYYVRYFFIDAIHITWYCKEMQFNYRFFQNRSNALCLHCPLLLNVISQTYSRQV